MLFRLAVDEFIDFCVIERQLSENTRSAYVSDLADFRKWLSPGTAPTAVTQALVKAYLAMMSGERKLAPATIRRRVACLRVFFRWLSRHTESPDPFANWQLKLPRRRRLPRNLSRIEISSLLFSLESGGSFSADTEGDLPVAVRLMVGTGVRVGELCKLRFDDVAPDGSSLRIHGKGSRDRMVYVTDPSLRFELCALVLERRRRSPCQLFMNRRGTPLRPQSVRSRLRRYGVILGFTRRVTPHMLRHTAATTLIEMGVDIRFVQRLLGHSSIATTEIYTHVSDQALRDTLERADVLATLVRRTSI
jgi:site-specific recombinase XerD